MGTLFFIQKNQKEKFQINTNVPPLFKFLDCFNASTKEGTFER